MSGSRIGKFNTTNTKAFPHPNSHFETIQSFLPKPV